MESVTTALAKVHRDYFEDKPKGGEGEQGFHTSGKAFKGKCHHCGKIGHKSANCWEKTGKKPNGGGGGAPKKDKSQKKKFTGKCNHCKKVGHKEADCWTKHGKPSKGEQANAANYEVAFASHETEREEAHVFIPVGPDPESVGSEEPKCEFGIPDSFFDDFESEPEESVEELWIPTMPIRPMPIHERKW